MTNQPSQSANVTAPMLHTTWPDCLDRLDHESIANEHNTQRHSQPGAAQGQPGQGEAAPGQVARLQRKNSKTFFIFAPERRDSRLYKLNDKPITGGNP